MKKVGRLASTVIFDGPVPHCGPVIRGSVQVTYSQGSSEQAELFGPLEVSITVSGRLKTKIKISDGNSSSNYRARVPLFSRRQPVYSGPLRLGNNEACRYPFEFVFPTQISNPSGNFRPGLAYNTDPDQEPPASMDYYYSGFSRDAEAHVQYGIDVHLAMPGIEINFPDPPGSSLFSTQPQIPFRYERGPVTTPLPENPTTTNGTRMFKDKCLIPESQRPHPKGFKQRTSALFTYTPRPSLYLSWSITTAETCHRGQPFLVHIRAQPKPEDSTAPEMPEIRLVSVQASVKAHVVCRAEATFSDKVHEGDQHAATDSAAALRDGDDGDDDRLFRERDQWTRTVALMRLTGLLGTEVRTAVVSRRYTLKISVTININGRTETMKRTCGLVVGPPLVDGGGGGGGVVVGGQVEEEGGTTAEPTLEVPSQPNVGGSEPLPAYEAVEVAGSASEMAAAAPPPFESVVR